MKQQFRAIIAAMLLFAGLLTVTNLNAGPSELNSKNSELSLSRDRLVVELKKSTVFLQIRSRLELQGQEPLLEKMAVLNIPGGDEEKKELLIPLTNRKGFLSGVLVALRNEKSEDFIFTLYTDKQLYEIVHSKEADMKTAQKMLHLFMFMDNQTFGTTLFRNIPAKFFSKRGEPKNPDENKNVHYRLAGPLGGIEFWEICILVHTPESCTCSNGGPENPEGCYDWQEGCADCSDEYCEWGFTVGSGTEGGNEGTGSGTSGGGNGDPSQTELNPCGGTWYRPQGCTGSGGVSTEDNSCEKSLNNVVTSLFVTSELQSANFIEQGAIIRKKEYEWVMLKNSFGLFKIIGYETGIHEFKNREWVWKDLIHNSCQVVGTIAGASVDLTEISAIPTIGKYNSIMATRFKLTTSIVCKEFPLSDSRVYSASIVFNIND